MELERTIVRDMKIDSFAITDQGTRKYQQDFWGLEIRGPVAAAVLCDGMGGLAGGEQASRLGVKLFLRDFWNAWPMDDIPDFLRKEALRLDQAVYGLEKQDGSRLNAGSTIVAVVIVQDRLYWMSVGDSRLYLFRDGEMTCLTQEHNYKTMLEEEMAAGLINLEYYNREIGQGEALTSYLGIGKLTLIDGNCPDFELEEEDILLLCSDGLYKTLAEEQIRALVNESGSCLEIAGRRMIETAGRRGVNGQDNTTLILLKVTGGN